MQHEAAVKAGRALDRGFTAYGDELERVEVFRYLGRLLAFDDNNLQAVRSNLKKARHVWARILRVLRADNASPRVCGMFYKATVQAVLLFGSETWCLTPAALKSPEGFHLRAAWRMASANKPHQESDNSWRYPDTPAVMEEVGLHPIAHYVEVRRQTIASYIVNRTLFNCCVNGERRRGTNPHLWWWEQPMHLDEVRAGAQAPAMVTDPEDVADSEG